MHATGIGQISDFALVPFGNAYFSGITNNTCFYGGIPPNCKAKTDPDAHSGSGAWYGLCGPSAKGPKPAGCFTGPVLCQHGPNECTANIIEACVVNLYPEGFWPFVACYEATSIPRDPSKDPQAPFTQMELCASKTNVIAAEIRACATDPTQSSALQLRTGMATLDLVPGHTGTPYILVGGKPTSASRVLSAVCANFGAANPKVALPAGCSTA